MNLKKKKDSIRLQRKQLRREADALQAELEIQYAEERSKPSHCLTDPPIITFLPASLDGCALYRMFIPHLNIVNSRFAGVNQGDLPFTAIADADVAVVQRLMDDRNWNAMIAMKREGLKIIYDLDDNMWNIPKYNPAYSLFKDTTGFKKCAIESSIVTVSTEPLKRAAEQNIDFKGLEVVVVPNAIDTKLFHPLPKKDKDYVTVAWAGTATHSQDLLQVSRQLPTLLQSEPSMHLSVTGMKIEEFQDHPRYTQIDYVSVAEYPSRLASWGFDIMLAPLEDNPFNRCKSNIKMLEATALGVPILVSMVRPYIDFCAKDEELSYCLCKNPRQWSDKIRELIHEPEKREYLVQRMRKVMNEHFNIEKVKNDWVKVAKDIL